MTEITRTPANPGGLQAMPAPLAASAEAVSVAASILAAGTVTSAIEQIGNLLSSYDGVDQVTIMMVQLHPDPPDRWEPLGERAWLRVWRRPGSRCLADLPEDSGKLSLPWISPLARHQVVAVPDAALLPPEASRDRWEMEQCHGLAMATRSISRNGELYGSVALVREYPAAWPAYYLSDIELLCNTLASRMAEARTEAILAEAVDRSERAAESQQHFFAAVGHELRTPIAAILGSAEILESDAGEALARRAAGDIAFAGTVQTDARVIMSAAEQLLAIVEDLLSTGRELGGRSESSWVDVADALGDVVHWLRAPSGVNDVTVVHAVEPGVLVRTTPSALRQILTNLVGNAIAYHHPGGQVTVTATRAHDEFGGPRVRIRVQDDGPGLTPEQQREVFKPFVRFAAPGIKGTGLGLSLSRSLAERDGGLMGVESAPGEGSSFWVDLPAAAADAQSA